MKTRSSRLRDAYVPSFNLLTRVSAAIPSSKVHILDLPTEILSDIFDKLTPHGKDLIGLNHLPDLLAVRATCRTFRAICNTLRVWHEKHFDLSHIVRTAVAANPPRGGISARWVAIELGTRKLFQLFKEDKVLLETMARKESWSFRTIPTMVIFADTIPRFRETVKDLDYQGYDEWEESQNTPATTINNAIAHLNHLPNLTSLSIAEYDGKVSLNQIAISCPSLKKLEFYSNTWYTGSLGGLRNLEKLIVWDYKLDKHTGSRAHLLPADSAASLKDLKLYAPGTRNNVYNSKHLLRFSNLEKFTIFPLCNRLCKTLFSANFLHLREFTTVVYSDPFLDMGNSIIPLFQTRSFAFLERLAILIEPFDEAFNFAYLELIRTITTHLPQLKSLQLTAGINTAWCQLFSQLRKLESFAWAASVDECIVSDNMDLVPFDRESVMFEVEISDEARDTLQGIVEAKIREAFGEFGTPPSIYVELFGESSGRDWDEIFEEYEGDD